MIDLRSDLLVTPTEAMWEAMRAANLGWATFGEDASVRAVEERVAAWLGKDAGLWVPTCGMANLVALSALAPEPARVVLEATAHILTSEGLWLTQVTRHEPISLWAPDGRPRPDRVEALVRDEGASVLCLENTHTRAGGTVLSVPLTEALAEAAHAYGARVHLDGARLANAAVALGVEPRALAAPCDTVSLSLNKGLGAPMGAVLAGSASFVADARPVLQRLGGASLHRAGIPAAAALVALDEGLAHVADDHRRARTLAARVAEVGGLALRPARIETNIVLVDVSGVCSGSEEFIAALAERGVRAMERDGARIRLVTHRGVGDAEIERAAEAIAAVAAELRASRRVVAEPAPGEAWGGPTPGDATAAPTLRAATPDDRDALFALHRATMREVVDATWGWDDVEQEAYFDEHFDPASWQVVQVDGADVGVLVVRREADAVVLDLVEIAPGWQGRGLGTALVREVTEDARAAGRPVELRVLHANDRARALYERLGFSRVGETETHVEMKG